MPRSRKRDRAFPVGLFIILGMVLLVAGVLWIRNITLRPNFNFIVAWEEPGRVEDGIPVFYRGVQVGRVTKTALAADKLSTRIHIGITEEDLRLADNVQVYVRTEGITGQRYIEIKAPEAPIRRYIAEGEMIWGSDNLTWEKIQAQLARIAENRTLEKILNRTERAMAKFESASEEWGHFNRQGRQFFANMEGPGRSALAGIESAAGDFSRNTAGADEALVSFRQASDRIGLTFDTLQRQLIETELIPTWSQAGNDISSGITGIQRDVRGGARSIQDVLNPRTPEVTEINNLLSSLQETGGMLESNLERLRRQNQDGQLNGHLVELQNLARHIRTTVQPDSVLDTKDPAQIRQQLSGLEQIGQQISTTANRLQPVLQAKVAKKAYQSPASAQKLLSNVQALESVGRNLSAQAASLQLRVNELAAASGNQRRAGGLIGGIATTISQIQLTAARFDCVAKEISNVLDQRFLGFKLFFGKPGGRYNCEDLEKRAGQR